MTKLYNSANLRCVNFKTGQRVLRRGSGRGHRRPSGEGDLATVPPSTDNPGPVHPRELRTSELLRRAAFELAASDELAEELRIRAIWIERARTDEAVSDERRRGVAAIEDAGDDPRRSRSSVVLRCKASEPCSFHEDGGSVDEPCPGQCDARGCTLDGYYEVGADYVVCAVHGAIVLLARAVSGALAAENADDADAGG